MPNDTTVVEEPRPGDEGVVDAPEEDGNGSGEDDGDGGEDDG